MSKPSNRYMQLAAYVLILVIFIIVIGATRDCSRLSISSEEGYSKGDTIDIALLFGPGAFYFEGDSMGGINYMVAQEFSKETGSPIKIWPVTEPSDAEDKLSKGMYDILASLPLNNRLKQKFPVSESIFLDKLVLVQRVDSISGDTLVKSSLDLDGKIITVAAGSPGALRMKNLAEEIGGKIEVKESPEMSDELLCLQVANGTVPFAVVNERVAKQIAAKYPSLIYDSSLSFTQFQVWVFNESDSVTFAGFNNWFDTFRSTEAYKEIIRKY